MIAMLRMQRRQRARRNRLRFGKKRAGIVVTSRRAPRQRRDRIMVARLPPLRARQPQPGGRSPAPRKPVWFPPAARVVCRPEPPIVAAASPEAAAEAPLPESMDDIERAYAEECGAIMRDFARQLAVAKTPGERRAIKTARKSAMAAAKEKAKRMKDARKAANMATRQSAPRRPRPPVEPRPV